MKALALGVDLGVYFETTKKGTLEKTTKKDTPSDVWSAS